MEHILQFGVSIDDEAIKKSVIDNVTRNVSKNLKKILTRYYKGILIRTGIGKTQ